MTSKTKQAATGSAPTGSSRSLDDPTSHVLPLVAQKVQVLHSPGLEAEGFGGGDWDCVVDVLDPYWPLRLPRDVKLCQCLQYDITGWYWVVADTERTLAIDTLEDASGIGKYGVSTSFLTDSGSRPSSSRRAAYLTMKRLRKGIDSVTEWRRISILASQRPSEFITILKDALGNRVGEELAQTVLSNRRPEPDLWRKALRRQRMSRVNTPRKFVRLPIAIIHRWTHRVFHPTGLRVLVVGPDGSGKSTIATGLIAECGGLFRRDMHYHWRPGLLPRLGDLLGREASDPTQPHATPTRGKVTSTLLLGYYWLDFMAGTWLRHIPTKIRTGLVVGERGWWDMVVDPKRYRLGASPTVMMWLGRLVPSPDLVLALEAPADVLLRRKAELPAEEISRQNQVWDDLAPGLPNVVKLDAKEPVERVLKEARSEVVRVLQRRATARLGTGWTGLSSRSRAGTSRWTIPRGPLAVAKNALSIYQPVTKKGLIGWHAARAFAAFGGFRLLPRGEAPESRVLDRVGAFLPRGGQVAVSRLNHPDRFLALLLDPVGNPVSIAKVDFDRAGQQALTREAEIVDKWGPSLPKPLHMPNLLANEEGLVIYEPIHWRPRRQPWLLPTEVAAALGGFQRGRDATGMVPLAHNDLAPWNLLLTDNGWYLLDWEEARIDGDPFFDMFHFLIQSNALLGRPSTKGILDGLNGQGWIGGALREYSSTSGHSLVSVNERMREYLEVSLIGLDDESTQGIKGIKSREALLALLPCR